MRCPHCEWCVAEWPLRTAPLSGVMWHPYPADYRGLKVGTVKCGPCEKCAAAALGKKGGSVSGPSKRRAVDYAELGRKGGLAGKGKKKPRAKGELPLGRPKKKASRPGGQGEGESD